MELMIFLLGSSDIWLCRKGNVEFNLIFHNIWHYNGSTTSQSHRCRRLRCWEELPSPSICEQLIQRIQWAHSWCSFPFKSTRIRSGENGQISSVGHSRSGEIQINCSNLLPRYLWSNADSQVALCVYDITNKESFKVLKTWVEELKAKGPANIGIFLFIKLLLLLETKLIELMTKKFPITKPKSILSQLEQSLSSQVLNKEKA